MIIRKLVCFGDSITWGFPYGTSYSWVHISSSKLGIPMINSGINGDTAADLVRRLKTDVISHDPSHVFIMAGTNDASINVPMEEFQDNILKITSAALSKGIEPLMGLPIPSSDRWLEYTLVKYRDWLCRLSQANKMAWLDFSPAMLSENNKVDSSYYMDDVHPSKKGYEKMAELFIEFCRKLK